MKVVKFKKLENQKNIIHGISMKEFGSMKNTDNTINRKNLESFLANLSLPKIGICMEQVHGGNVAVVSDKNKLLIENTDGLVTDKKNIPLCVLTADCLPLLFFDIKKEVIGIAHGGRKGLKLGIVENVVKEFIQQFGSDPRDIIVGMGPGIEKNCYEVEGAFMDIRKMTINSLLASGVLMENIESLDICTKDSSDFYSYRNGDDTNRFVSVISLV